MLEYVMASIKYEDITEKARAYALKSMSWADDAESLCRMMHGLFGIADEHVDRDIPSEEKAFAACRSGCSFCCRVNVPVLYPEAVVIASYLKNTLNPTVLGGLKMQMENFVLSVAGYDEEERIAANIKCTFLGRFNECTIHGVRPFACRAVTSADASACRDAMRMPLLEDAVLVPMNIKHKSINDSVFLGLAEALKSRGKNDLSGELTASVLTLLKS